MNNETILKVTPGISVGVFKLAVLRVIFSCLTSISGKLSDDLESSKMLLKYSTAEHISRKIYLFKLNEKKPKNNNDEEGIEINDIDDVEKEEEEESNGSENGVSSNENSSVRLKLIPLLLKIVALVWKNCKNNNNDNNNINNNNGNDNNNNGNDNINININRILVNGSEGDLNLNSKSILSDYIKNWNLQSKKELKQKEYSESTNSYVTIEILKSLNNEKSLISIITEPFKQMLTISKGIYSDSKDSNSFQICNSPELTSIISGKNVNGKRKTKNILSPINVKEFVHIQSTSSSSSSSLSLGASFDLFIALQNDDINNDKCGIEVYNIVQSAISFIFSSVQNCNDFYQSIDRCETFHSGDVTKILSQCMYMWSVNMVRATTLDSRKESLKILLFWADDVLLSFISNPFQTQSNSQFFDAPQFSSPDVKYPPRSKSRQNATPNALSSILNSGGVHTVRAMALAFNMLQGVLLILSDALVMRVGADDITGFLGTFTAKASEMSDKSEILKVLKPILERLSGLLNPFGGEKQRVAENLKKFILCTEVTGVVDTENVDDNDENNDENCNNNNNDNNYNSPTSHRKNIEKSTVDADFNSVSNIKLKFELNKKCAVTEVDTSSFEAEFHRLSL